SSRAARFLIAHYEPSLSDAGGIALAGHINSLPERSTLAPLSQPPATPPSTSSAARIGVVTLEKASAATAIATSVTLAPATPQPRAPASTPACRSRSPT